MGNTLDNPFVIPGIRYCEGLGCVIEVFRGGLSTDEKKPKNKNCAKKTKLNHEFSDCKKKTRNFNFSSLLIVTNH
jgi:hypothetical protein